MTTWRPSYSAVGGKEGVVYQSGIAASDHRPSTWTEGFSLNSLFSSPNTRACHWFSIRLSHGPYRNRQVTPASTPPMPSQPGSTNRRASPWPSP